MEVAYVSRFENGLPVFREVDAPGLEALIKPGYSRPLEDVYCPHILTGRLPELIPDTAEEPICQAIVRLAIDDAGAGYSSMQHILQLRPDIIKLDTGLVRDVDTDAAKRALAAALCFFGQETGAQIVDEGIDTLAERQALEALGVCKGQGYLLGWPMELATATAAAG